MCNKSGLQAILLKKLALGVLNLLTNVTSGHSCCQTGNKLHIHSAVYFHLQLVILNKSVKAINIAINIVDEIVNQHAGFP